MTTVIRNSPGLRKDTADVEQRLWYFLKANDLGLNFRRQYSIGLYRVDFACLEKSLVIEIDGGPYGSYRMKDARQDNSLRAQGFTVLRFWRNEIICDIDGVLKMIMAQVTPSVSPARKIEKMQEAA